MTLEDQIQAARDLRDRGRWKEALERYKELSAENPDDAGLLVDLGRAFVFNNEPDKAEPVFAKAAEKAPEEFDAWFNWAAMLLQTGDLAAARHAMTRAFEIEPDRVSDIEGALACAELPDGMEDVPPWRGEPLEGKSILVCANQGHGDTLQWIRHIAGLKALGAQVALGCQGRLVPLLQGQGLADLVLDSQGPLPICDYILPISALILRLTRSPVGLVEAPQPYIAIDPPRVADARQLLSGSDRLKVGLVWSGSAQNPRDRMRSLNSRLLLPLLAEESLECYCLQYPTPKDDPLVSDPRCHVFEGVSRGFVDDAALICALDCLVTIDTAAVHLAGSLSQKTALLLNKSPDPRWDQPRDLPLYESVSAYRQEVEGEWEAPITRLIEDLVAAKAT